MTCYSLNTWNKLDPQFANGDVCYLMKGISRGRDGHGSIWFWWPQTQARWLFSIAPLMLWLFCVIMFHHTHWTLSFFSERERSFFSSSPEYVLYNEEAGKMAWKHSTPAAEKRMRGSSRAPVCFQASDQHSSLALLWHFRDRIDPSRDPVK